MNDLRPRAARALYAAALLSGVASAQTWIALDATPPGTPAEVVVDVQSSTPADTFLDVIVHGFWTEDVAPGDGNVYQRLTFPGLGTLGQVGAPELPTARVRLAVSTPSPIVSLVSVVDLDPHAFGGQLVHPTPIEARDEAFDPTEDPGPGDPDGVDEVFVLDSIVYAGGPYPSTPGLAVAPVSDLLGAIPGAVTEIHPARFDPGSGVLSVSGHLRVHLSAPGVAITRPPMTRDRAALAAATFVNWASQDESFPTDDTHFAGRYLVVTPKAYLGALEPFVRFRRARGFDVEVLALGSLPANGCAQIRAAIDAWYGAGDPWADHYALLVGDASELPQCGAPTNPPLRTDDLYGSPSDGDLHEEIFVGRLSVDDAKDLVRQTARIETYVRDPVGEHLDEALVVAHADDAPGGYAATAQAIASASYASPPVFSTLSGATPGVDDAAVVAALQTGVGLLAYRGHATQTSWSGWSADDWHKNALLGVGATTAGVVWSFSCWNHALSYDAGDADTLGEAWLEVPGSGAVASYGSGDQAGRTQNDALARAMFDGLYDAGLLRHGQLVAFAEGRAADRVPGENAWMYSLFGDPSMRVRREEARELFLSFPTLVPVCPPGSTCPSIDVRVTDASGTPVPDVLVALHKAGPPGGPVDILANAYTDGNGSATFPTGPSDVSAVIDVSGSDPFGNDAVGEMGVVDGVWANWGGAVAGDQGYPLVIGTGALTPGSDAELRLTKAQANSPAGLFVSTSSTPVPFKGGTLYPVPWALLLQLATDAQGEVEFVAPLPALPPGTELWFQWAIADDVALGGIALSNAVQGVVP